MQIIGFDRLGTSYADESPFDREIGFTLPSMMRVHNEIVLRRVEDTPDHRDVALCYSSNIVGDTNIGQLFWFYHCFKQTDRLGNLDFVRGDRYYGFFNPGIDGTVKKLDEESLSVVREVVCSGKYNLCEDLRVKRENNLIVDVYCKRQLQRLDETGLLQIASEHVKDIETLGRIPGPMFEFFCYLPRGTRGKGGFNICGKSLQEYREHILDRKANKKA